MKHYSVKMSDGSRYDFDAKSLQESNPKGFLKIKDDSKTVWLNDQHIVSITVKGDDNDSKRIS